MTSHHNAATTTAGAKGISAAKRAGKVEAETIEAIEVIAIGAKVVAMRSLVATMGCREADVAAQRRCKTPREGHRRNGRVMITEVPYRRSSTQGQEQVMPGMDMAT